MNRQDKTTTQQSTELVYSPTARFFHWATVAFITVQLPLGLYMVWRGAATNFDATTNWLYDLHKLLGFILLWFVVARLVYRLSHGAPPDEPTLEWWQKAAAHLNHWGLYVLLLLVPLLGWIGISLYGARTIFGLFSLPPLANQDQKAAETVFWLHYWAAMLVLAMVAIHISAALFHHLIRRDGVLRRMLPGLNPPQR